MKHRTAAQQATIIALTEQVAPKILGWHCTSTGPVRGHVYVDADHDDRGESEASFTVHEDGSVDWWTGNPLPISTTSEPGSLPEPSPPASPLEGHETGPDKQTGDDRSAVARKSGHNFAPGCTCSGGVDAYGHAWHDSSRCPLHGRFTREGSGGES